MKFKLLALLSLVTLLGNSQILFTHNWSNGFGDINNDEMRGSVIDATGNIYVVGRMDGIIDFDPGPGVSSFTAPTSCYFAKYSSSGALIWAKVLDGQGQGVSGGQCIGLDGSNNVYISGYFQGPFVDFDPGIGTYTLQPAQNDMFIAKYTSAGAFIWAKGIGGLSTSVNGSAMNVNTAGDIVISGDYNMSFDIDAGPAVTTLTNSGFEDVFVTKYDNAGNFVWGFGFGASEPDLAPGLDIDPSGNIYVCGKFNYTPDFDPGPGTTTITTNAEDMFLAKYTPTGSLVWVESIGGPSADVAYRIKYSASGELVLSGAVKSMTFDADPGVGVTPLVKVGGVGADDAFLGKYNSTTGNLIFAKIMGASGVADVIAYDLITDAQNNIYLAGHFANIVDFDMGPAVASVTATNFMYNDIFLAKYDNSGNYIYAKNMGGGNLSGNTACNLGLFGNDIFVTGEYNNIVDMDPGPLNPTITPYGGTDFFIAKYTECNLPQLSGITSPGFVCSGTTITLSVIGGSLNQAASWQWYTGSCGGTPLGTGITVTTTAVAGNTYYVRGEGGCVAPGGTCLNMTVTVLPLTNISGQVTTNTLAPVPVSGSVTLYRYETQFTKFDSITTVALDAMGNYTIPSAPSVSCIIKAIPTATNQIITYAPSAVSWMDAGVFTHGCAVTSTQNINVIALANFGGGPGMLTGKVVQGVKYGQKGAGITAPGNPIKGISVKGGRNPGGNIGAQDMTGPSGSYTLGGLMMSGVGEHYFVIVDIPGLDTNNTYHKVIAVGTETFTQLDFVVDSAKIHPMIFVGVKEEKFDRNSFKVFPNPTNGKLFIELEIDKPCDVKIELLDIMGKKVETILPLSYQESKQTTIISNLKKHPAGVYFVSIEAGGSKKISKILVSE